MKQLNAKDKIDSLIDAADAGIKSSQFAINMLLAIHVLCNKTGAPPTRGAVADVLYQVLDLDYGTVIGDVSEYLNAFRGSLITQLLTHRDGRVRENALNDTARAYIKRIRTKLNKKSWVVVE